MLAKTGGVMPRIVVVLSCISLLSICHPPSIQAQSRPARMRFEVMDADHNGIITKDEWQGSARSFEVHDWNGDGQLSGREVAIGAQRGTPVEEADHVPNRMERNVNWSATGFTNLDHN